MRNFESLFLQWEKRSSLFRMEYLTVTFLLILLIRKLVNKFHRRWRYKAFPWSGPFRYDKFENLPGLWGLPLIGALHHIPDMKGTIDMIFEVCKRFGPLIKVKVFIETFVVVNNAQDAHTLLMSNDMAHFPKNPLLYDIAFAKILGSGLITGTGQHWKHHKKLLSPAFSYKSFQNYCQIFIKSSESLVSELEHLFGNVGQDETKQISTAIHCCGLQIITEAVMGLKVYNNEDGFKYHDNIRKVKDLFGRRIHKPLLLLEFFWNFHPMSKEYDGCVKTLNDLTKKMIEMRRNISNETDCLNGNVNGKTMIDEMLKVNLPDKDILDEVNTMVVAGFETTSATVHYMMHLLALNREAQRLCQEEIDKIFADSMLCPDGKLTFEAISEMKYVERCVNETLRLYPAVFGIIRKLEKPLRLNETLTIPSGVNVAVSTLSIHRNPEYFPDPSKFDPDRFLPENVKARHPGSYLPFSTGPRVCMGQKFGIMAAKTMAAQILRNFQVFTTDQVEDVTLLPTIFLTPERDYNFILKKRTKFYQ